MMQLMLLYGLVLRSEDSKDASFEASKKLFEYKGEVQLSICVRELGSFI